MGQHLEMVQSYNLQVYAQVCGCGCGMIGREEGVQILWHRSSFKSL